MDFKLFNAILSMDAYNRGYAGGIQLSDTVGTKIGNVTISATRGQADAESIGFYAIAYNAGGAGKIINVNHQKVCLINGASLFSFVPSCRSNQS